MRPSVCAGARLVNETIANGKMFESDAWRTLTRNCIENKSTLHFIGLLSDGNVHSNISHLKSMLRKAKEQEWQGPAYISCWTGGMSMPHLR